MTEKYKRVPVEIIDRFSEINPSNYDHDDVCALNAWGVELVLAAAPDVPSERDAVIEECAIEIEAMREKSRNHLFRSAMTVAAGNLRAKKSNYTENPAPKKFCEKCGYLGEDEVHEKPTGGQCNYCAWDITQPATTDPRDEVIRLAREAIEGAYDYVEEAEQRYLQEYGEKFRPQRLQYIRDIKSDCDKALAAIDSLPKKGGE